MNTGSDSRGYGPVCFFSLNTEWSWVDGNGISPGKPQSCKEVAKDPHGHCPIYLRSCRVQQCRTFEEVSKTLGLQQTSILQFIRTRMPNKSPDDQAKIQGGDAGFQHKPLNSFELRTVKQLKSPGFHGFPMSSHGGPLTSWRIRLPGPTESWAPLTVCKWHHGRCCGWGGDKPISSQSFDLALVLFLGGSCSQKDSEGLRWQRTDAGMWP